MLRSRFVLALPLAAALLLGSAGCASQPSADPSAPSAPVASTSAAPAPSSSPTAEAPASDAVLTLSLDSASLADGPTLEYSLSAVDAWTAALGSAPSTSPAEGPPGYDLQMTVLEWPGLKMTVPNDGSATGRLFVSSPTVAGHPVVTAEGLSVGSTRAEGVAAGAVDGFDSTELRLGFRDVPGTQSLQRPGEVGREYVMLVLDGDSVKSILVPADDYSDL